MHFRGRTLLLIVLCLYAASVLHAQPPSTNTIAFVDLDEVLESPRLKKRLETLEVTPRSATSVKREPDLQQTVAAVEALEEQLLAPNLTPEKLAELNANYIKKNRELRKRLEVDKLRPSLQFAVKRELDALIKVVATENKISVVLYRSKKERMLNEASQSLLRNPIVYTDPTLDITKLIIEKIEQLETKASGEREK